MSIVSLRITGMIAAGAKYAVKANRFEGARIAKAVRAFFFADLYGLEGPSFSQAGSLGRAIRALVRRKIRLCLLLWIKTSQ